MRWLPAVAMMMVSTISYIDRNTLALLAPTILHDRHLSNEQYGFIISAFSIAYMLANPVWGKIIDRIGVRKGMFFAVSLWTAASAAHAFAVGFRSFSTARIILGFGEGATFPGSLRTVVATLPIEKRSRGIAISYSGGSLGALITPIIVTPVAARLGWTGAFWFTGFVGAAWLLLWGFVSRRKELRTHTRMPENSVLDHVRWRDARLWAFVSAYALGGFPAAFVLYQSAIYLSAAMGKSQIEIGHVLWIPPLGWELGYFFWGWMIDRFADAGRSAVAMRRLFGVFALLTLPLAALGQVASFAATLAIMSVAMFMAAGFIIGAVAYVTTRYSMRESGWLAGLGAGSWSAVVALVMPEAGRLFDLHAYNAAFAMAAAIPSAGYVCWRTLDKLGEDGFRHR